MSKTIKLEGPVYDELERFRRKKETFSEAVNRALILLSKVKALLPLLINQSENALRDSDNHDRHG